MIFLTEHPECLLPHKQAQPGGFPPTRRPADFTIYGLPCALPVLLVGENTIEGALRDAGEMAGEV